MTIDQTTAELSALVRRALDRAADAYLDGRNNGGEALTNIALTVDRARMQLEQDGESYLDAAEAFVIAARNHLDALDRNRHIVVATAEAGEDVLVIVPTWNHVPDLLDTWSADLPCTVRRAKGTEQIDIDNGGTIWFASERSHAARGRAVDVVYIARGVDITAGLLGEVYPCTTTSKTGRVLIEVAE